jgi:succinate dehydrogenase/fumarate reductase cytochrome b subunit
MSALSFLDRERSVAGPGYSRWLVPPAALAIHLCIGQVYAFSVFKLPLVEKFDTSETAIAIVFSIAIVMLGLAAAFGGKWMERNGPRKAMFLSAVCFSSGLLVGALGVATEQLWLLYLGYGVIGGIGLGIGYISPVSTLIKWFPDRPGLATGMAIMGFGGGAFIASALSRGCSAPTRTSRRRTSRPTPSCRRSSRSGSGYLVFMMFGVFTVRVPPTGWKPDGWSPKENAGNKMMTTANISADNAIKTPAFWCLWIVLFCNVTAGIGILEQAAPMIQDFFPDEVDAADRGRLRGPAVAVQHGRPVPVVLDLGLHRPQADLHDLPRRRRGAVLLPAHRRQHVRGRLRDAGRRDPDLLRRRVRHGAGVPQGHVRDLPGRRHPRPAAHRLVRGGGRRAADRQRHHREPARGRRRGRCRLPAVAAGHGRLLAVGFVANLLVRPVDERFHEKTEPADAAGRHGRDRRHQPQHEQQCRRHRDLLRQLRVRVQHRHEPVRHQGAAMTATAQPHQQAQQQDKPKGLVARLAFAWAFVGIPLAYGVYETAKKAAALFTG